MAASMRSLGMLTARAFWMVRRSVELEAGSVPPAFTAMVMSLAMRANCLAMRFQRANMVCLRTSKMRPMKAWCTNGAGPANRGAASIRALGKMRSARVRARPRPPLLGELRLQHAHAPQLPAQGALDVAQPVVQVDLLVGQPLLL